MPHYHLKDLPEREVVPGFHGKFTHSDEITLAFWRIEKDAVLPEHSHPQEQATHVIEGVLELTMQGETRQLDPGQVLFIPGGVVHSGRAVTECRVVDVFHPARDDYR